MRLGRLFEKVHDLLEVIFGAPGGGTQALVEELEKDIVLIGHVIGAATAVLDGRGEANIRRRLGECRGVQFVISQSAEDGLGGGDVGIIYLPMGGCVDGGLQMEFLRENALADMD